ncbi:hypothetical protein MW887_002384 [Aspergillus wentii]|nr:hypothetical protein MW887_002384 [Aspergillus wentii]
MPNSNTTRVFSLNFIGDIMLGRLIDQLWPQHVDNPHDHRTITNFLDNYPYLESYTPKSPWGTALPLFHTSDLNLINLETAVTTSPEPWPNKAFNYRMHPANVAALHEARIDYANLANNHVLDFGTEGLVETVWTLRESRIAFSGAGERTKEAVSGTVVRLPRVEKEGGKVARASSVSASASASASERQKGDDSEKQEHYQIHISSASDHPSSWSDIPTFHFIDYTSSTRQSLKSLLTSPSSQSAALKIFSVHWGPNYAWRPDSQIRSMAHFLVDECGVDIVHGHSAHHVQGVERYKGKLIIYGCGDFVDDYALNEQFRNDLGGVWRVWVRGVEGDGDGGKVKKLGLDRLEIFPTRCDRFQVTLLNRADEDHGWVRRRITKLTEEMGTKVRKDLGEEGQIVIDLDVD